MINWVLEVEVPEDVACPVDDMKKSDCSRSFVQRGWKEGRGNKDSGYELVVYLGEGDADGARRKAVLTPTRQDIDAGDLTCRRVMEELRHTWAQALRVRIRFSSVLYHTADLTTGLRVCSYWES